MIEHTGKDRPEVFRGDLLQVAARSALDGEPIEAIATRLGVSDDTVLQMLRFPTAPYLAAMNVVDNEDTLGTVYDLKRIRAYKEMLKSLPGVDPTPAAAGKNQKEAPLLSKLHMRRVEVRLWYLLHTFAGETFARSHIEKLLLGMTEGASEEECSAVLDRFIAQGKLQAAVKDLIFPP